MSDDRYEAVSALADGEFLDEDLPALTAAVTADPQARRRWLSYHLIGEAMRDGLPERLDPIFAERLRATIADEPAILAPKNRLAGVLKPVIGLAIAASVATIAVITAQNLNNASPVDAGPGLAGTVDAVISPDVQVVSFGAEAVANGDEGALEITAVPGVLSQIQGAREDEDLPLDEQEQETEAQNIKP